jgi:hypothetical protein
MIPHILILSLALQASAAVLRPLDLSLPVAALEARPDIVLAPEHQSNHNPNTSNTQSTLTSDGRGDPTRGSHREHEQKEHVRRWGGFVPYGEEDDQTLVRRGLFKRAPAYRGTMMMDCKRAREACQNACWYQNCVRGAQGSTTAVLYTYGGNDWDSVEYAQNKVESGVDVTESTPCRRWPFGQLFWDSYPFVRLIVVVGLDWD